MEDIAQIQRDRLKGIAQGVTAIQWVTLPHPQFDVRESTLLWGESHYAALSYVDLLYFHQSMSFTVDELVAAVGDESARTQIGALISLGVVALQAPRACSIGIRSSPTLVPNGALMGRWQDTGRSLVPVAYTHAKEWAKCGKYLKQRKQELGVLDAGSSDLRIVLDWIKASQDGRWTSKDNMPTSPMIHRAVGELESNWAAYAANKKPLEGWGRLNAYLRELSSRSIRVPPMIPWSLIVPPSRDTSTATRKPS